MNALENRLTAWQAYLRNRIRSAEDGLIETVADSGFIEAGELSGLMRVSNYRGLVYHLGRSLRMPEHLMLRCIRAAVAVGAIKSAFLRIRSALWRHCGGYLVYVLIPLGEPVIRARSLWVTLVCSPAFVAGCSRLDALTREALLRLSNLLFSFLVFGATSELAIKLARWLRQALWPTIARVARIAQLMVATCALRVRLLGTERWTVLTVMKVFFALTRSYIADKPGGEPANVVADAVLGQLPSAGRPQRTTSELWVDSSPEGPLFEITPVQGLKELWQRIDAMTWLNKSTYEEVIATFDQDPEEVVKTVNQIRRPPRPILSAVLVATGLRMGIGDRLARLRHPHLRRESSRWAFFGSRQKAWSMGGRCTIITPINKYQEARILCGKLTARMLELTLMLPEESRIRFVFALPVCRPGTGHAHDRDKLKKLLEDSVVGCYFPSGIEISMLDGLNTDVALPNIKGLPLILALRQLSLSQVDGDVIILSEMNDSASWLNIWHMIAVLPSQGASLVTGRRPILSAGKSVAGHAATRLFNLLFRFLVPNVDAHDSSSVLKAMTVSSMREIIGDLTSLDYSIDQDILAMMAVRGEVIETPIEWYQSLGPWGHERPVSSQLASLARIARKTVFKRRLARSPTAWLPFDAGFDFKALINARGDVLKGYAIERNRLILLLSAVRSILKPASVDKEGHREYAALMPIAIRLLEIVGQGPLKAILRVAEGRYRDPLPAVLEQLKYHVPAIVETALEWNPQIDTPTGKTSPFVFGLRQPYATLGTLSSALDWNTRSGNYEDIADTLQAICRLQRELLAYGVVDPDMKSLLDCGIFVEDTSIRVKHLDFAGFIRDPFVIEAVLIELPDKFTSMRDFYQISRRLGATPQGRTLVVKLRDEMVEFLKEVPQQLRIPKPVTFATDASESAARLHKYCPTRQELTDHVIATAKFATHAPICPHPFQELMRRAIGYGCDQVLTSGTDVAVQHHAVDTPLPEPLFLARRDLADAIHQAMKEFAPGVGYEIRDSDQPDALPLMRLLDDAAKLPGSRSRVLMLFGGQSRRMQHLMGDRNSSHKGLLTIFGRPLFLHALETIQVASYLYPGLIWVIHPDTLCLWSGRRHSGNPCNRIVAPLPQDAIRLLESYPGRREGSPGGTEVIAKLFARCRLAVQTGGYSLPSVIGLNRDVLTGHSENDALFGDAAESDFWGYMSGQLGLTARYWEGDIEVPALQTWFDIDDPVQVMALYKHMLIPGFAEYFGVTASNACFDEFGWDHCVEASSTVSYADGRDKCKITFRDCVFDHSVVTVEVAPNIKSAFIEGLVVANSNVMLRIVTPIVRNTLVYGVTTAPGAAVLLALDNQVVGPVPDGEPASVPLVLQAFSRDGGRNEVLRCPSIQSRSQI